MHQISRKKLEQNYFINSKEIFRPYKYNSYYIYIHYFFQSHWKTKIKDTRIDIWTSFDYPYTFNQRIAILLG